ncbi:MAG: AAA family ATPase [Caldilineaceae bacterium]
MKFPYGLADFAALRREGYVYLDRTHYLRVVEERGKQLVFLRPRRFGKSLWLSTLANYYDVAHVDDFALLFADLAIGQNPTPLHNQYFILRWDFSKVAAFGTVDEVVQALYDHINARIVDFGTRYADQVARTPQIDRENAIYSFESLLSAVAGQPYKLYLLIDEYDNFANEIAMGGARSEDERYHVMVTGDGILKTLFKNVKAAIGEGRLDRVFITGVSPMLLSDLTSGFNTASDISLERQMHDLCGFTEAEVAHLVQQVGAGCGFTPPQSEEMAQLMRTFYNGYTFRHDAPGVIYNPTLCLYFLDALQRECEPPSEMLDVNLAMDKNKLEYIVSRPGGEQLIQGLLENQQDVGTQRIVNRFQLQDLVKPAQEADNLASLLFYFGLVTVSGRTKTGKLRLQIPNLVTRGLYFEQLRVLLLPDVSHRDEGRETAEQLWSMGDLQPLCAFITTRVYRAFSNRDYRHANELTVKALFLSLLYNDLMFIVDSEPELERRYADLTMLLRPEYRPYQLFDLLIEFKYVELSQVGLSAAEVRRKDKSELAALTAVQDAFRDARDALSAYRDTLQTKYGALLKLRVYAIVSLAFEQILWEEVEG